MDFKSPFILDALGKKIPADFKIKTDAESYKISFSLKEIAPVKEAVLFCGKHGFSTNTPLYGDGYQKLTQYRGTIENFDSFTGYTDKDHYKMP
ncbi:MAG: hypothetical protein ACI4RF_00775, partial [Eubacterium sp.]